MQQRDTAMATADEHPDRRVHPRVTTPVPVSVQLSPHGEVYAKTRDVSDGGAFVLLDRAALPAVGETVGVLFPGDDEEGWVSMRVARVEPGGVGLFFV